MRKLVQNQETGEILKVWQLWAIGNAHVVTIPAEIARLAGTDEEDNRWLVVEEGDGALAFHLRVLTQEEVDTIDWD